MTAFVTQIREQFKTDLTRAGKIVSFTPATHDITIKHLRVAVKQAAQREGIAVEIRTIDGQLYVRRTDFPPVIPGDTEHPMIATLEAMRPWPDDEYHDRKQAAIDAAIASIEAVEMIGDLS